MAGEEAVEKKEAETVEKLSKPRDHLSGYLKVLHSEADFEYEEEISRNPYSLKAWWRYLDHKKTGKQKMRNIVYERALKFLPGSYKLWHAYLSERVGTLDNKCVTDPACEVVINTFERALVSMHKMPRMWLDYCALLVRLQKGTAVRRAFDRALQALPITQHHRMWEEYLTWAQGFGSAETCIRVYRRFLMYDPQGREDYVDYLESIGEIEEAASQLAICVNDDTFVGTKGTTKHKLWMRLCDMCATHPEQVQSLKVEAIVRSGLSRFTDEIGRLWCRLADYYIRLGQLERARDIYEEGINSVTTVRDFTLIFDAYSQYEESVLTAKMQMLEEEEEENEEEEKEEGVEDLDQDGDDVELRLARLEYLLDRRPVLLSSVLLRQNPHNVHEWHKRAKLFADNPKKVIVCYTEAVKTVDPELAVGKLHSLWVAFAKFYEEHKDLNNARVILKKATEVNYRGVDELASVFCFWAEMELRHDNYDEALQVMQQAVTEPPEAVQRKREAAALSRNKDKQRQALDIPVQDRVHKSTKVWALYLDLEESLGTLETTRAAYERALALKVATPQMILNCAVFLEENKYFEDSFRIYEKGINTFKFPHVKEIWSTYLKKFVDRYKGTKLERARDLFEQVLQSVPSKDSAQFYIDYAKLEENYGLSRHAMAVYDRACEAVPDEEKYDMFLLYIKKAEQFYGATNTRPIYEKAIEKLDDNGAKKMCLEFSSMEKKLGEVDRARALLVHGSQFADPRRDPGYWKTWHEFEVSFGNEETFREMLRVKRSVQTAFSQVNYMAAEMAAGDMPVTSDADALRRQQEREANQKGGSMQFVEASGQKRKAEAGGATETDIEALERQAARIKAAAASAANAEGDVGAGAEGGVAENPEEIELDLDEEEEEDEDKAPEGEVQIQQKEVPAAVFGSAAVDTKEGAEETEKPLGALARLKKK